MTALTPEFHDDKEARYRALRLRIEALIEGEDDLTALLSTVVCELHHTFECFHWTGFYRVVGRELRVGPYQGGHGCLRIDFGRGVCGAAARSLRTQRYDDIHEAPDHIACSSTTVSEIVVPVLSASGHLLAVLDIDSDLRAAFDDVDQRELESLAAFVAARWAQCTTP